MPTRVACRVTRAGERCSAPGERHFSEESTWSQARQCAPRSLSRPLARRRSRRCAGAAPPAGPPRSRARTSAQRRGRRRPPTLPGGYKHLVVIYEENHSFDNLYGGWGRVDGQHVDGARADAAARDPGRPGRHAVRLPAAGRRQPDQPAAADDLPGHRPRHRRQPLRATSRSRSTTTSGRRTRPARRRGRLRAQRRAEGARRRCPAAAPATWCTASTRSSTSSTAASRTATSPAPTRSA